MEKAFTLKQLNLSIKKLIEGIDKDFWITAELAQVSIQQHIYLEFVQKEEEQIVAKARAVLWAGQRIALENKLDSLFYELLQEGTKVLVKVRVTFHEIHGLSLVVLDLDPSYTLGELEQQRQETIRKLETEDLLERQQQLHFPLVPQRIAVLSSEDAAGLNDFEEQLSNNAFGYAFQTTLFPTLVQGARASLAIRQQLATIETERYDAVVLIRGGGSRLDLECFNDYDLSKALATFPLPIIAGIGHQRDQTVSDLVAYLSVKTPTAAAEFLIRRTEFFEASLHEGLENIVTLANEEINQQQLAIREQLFLLQQAASTHLSREKEMLVRSQMLVEQLSLQLLIKSADDLQHIKREIHLLDPKTVLRRGYSMTLKEGKIITSAQSVKAGDVLQTRMHDSIIESEVLHTNKEDG